jgi:hypothetical protein
MQKKQNIATYLVGWEEKQTKVRSARYALYITASVDYVLDVLTIILHVHNPMVGCLCTTTMVVIHYFPYMLYHSFDQVPTTTFSVLTRV